MRVTQYGNGIDLDAMLTTDQIQKIRARHAGGSVEFWIHLGPRYKDMIDEVLQYLTPTEAMALAKGLERCACAALKEGA